MNRRLGEWLAIAVVVGLFVMLAFAAPAAAAGEPPGSSTVLAASAVIFTAALLSSIAGFAFSALAGAPLLLLLGDPVQTVAAMVACSIAIQAYCVWALRRLIDWRALRPFIAGGVITVPLGTWLLAQIPAPAFAVGLGALLVAYGSYMLVRGEPPVLRGGWRHDALAGALGGLAGGLAGFPGSVVTVWCGMRGWTKERQRAVYQPYILAMQLEALACLSVQAPVTLSPAPFLVYVPAALIAACGGVAIFRRMTAGQFRVAVSALLLVSGATLLRHGVL